jgi:hypothetical protein
MTTIAIPRTRPRYVRSLLFAVVVVALVLSSFLIGRATHHSTARVQIIRPVPTLTTSQSGTSNGFDCQGVRHGAC